MGHIIHLNFMIFLFLHSFDLISLVIIVNSLLVIIIFQFISQFNNRLLIIHKSFSLIIMNSSIGFDVYLNFLVLLSCFQALSNIHGTRKFLFLCFDLALIMFLLMLDFFIRHELLLCLLELLFHSSIIYLSHVLFIHYVLKLLKFFFLISFCFVISSSKHVLMAHDFLLFDLQKLNFSIK